MSTVPTETPARPAYGSVERYAEIIRETGTGRRQSYVVERSLIDFTVETGEDDTARIERIRNILAAGELIREEMAAR